MWTNAGRAALAGQLLDVMGAGVRPLGVGGPRCAEVDALSKHLGCPAESDLRKLLIDRPAAFLLVMSLEDATISDLKAAAANGSRVLCLEPVAAELSELESADTPGQPGAIRCVPAFTQSPGYLAAADPHEQIDGPSLVRFSSHGPPGRGSLFARLLDGWATALGFTPLPETIDARLRRPAGPGSANGNDALRPRAIAGWLSAHARTADGGAVLIEAGDTAADPVPRRELSVVSGRVQLRVDDTSYQLHADAADAPDAGGDAGKRLTFVDLLTASWHRLMERPGPAAPPHQQAQALACVHACLLSARTGQPESPGNLLRLSRT